MKPSSAPWKNRTLAGLVLLALFGAGVATGIGIARFTQKPLQPRTEKRFQGRRLYRGLDLDRQQERAIDAIFHKYRPELDALLQETYPRTLEIQEKIDREIRELLTPAQRERLERIRQHRPRGRGRRHHGMGLGPMDGRGYHP